MILRFRHKGLERLVTAGNASGVSAQHVRRIQLILGLLMRLWLDLQLQYDAWEAEQRAPAIKVKPLAPPPAPMPV